MSHWLPITEAQARSHPSYGIKGFAGAFRNLLALTPALWFISSIVNLQQVIEVRGKLESVDGLLVVAPAIIFFWACWNANALGKHDKRFFPSLYGLLAIGPVLIIVPSLTWMMNSRLRHDVKDVAENYLAFCVAWAFWSAAIVLFVLFSRRINVTLRHRIRSSDAYLSHMKEKT